MESTGTQFSGSIRIVAAFSVAALLIVIGIKIERSVAEAPIIRPPLSVTQLSDRSFVKEIDTDADGVPDWQETLLGLNIASADTDGDGVFDADEKVIVPESVTTQQATATERIYSRIVDEYNMLKQSGRYNIQVGRALGMKIAGDIRVVTPFDPYTYANAHFIADTSAVAVAAHRLALQDALEPILEFREPELMLYARYLETRDENQIDAISARADAYRNAAETLLKIPTPIDMRDDHLATANALSFFASVLDTLVTRVNDPMASLATLPVYQESERYISTTVTKLTDHYRKVLAVTPI